MKFLIIKLIQIYMKAVSPLMGASCRFYPTCSHYTMEAIEKHGVIKGLYYGVRRIMKCQPYYNGKFEDPVPPLKCKERK